MNKPTKRKTTAAKKTDSIAATKFRRSATIAGGYTFTREEDGQYVILNKDGSTLCTFPTERAVLDWIDERRREYWEKKKAEREAKSVQDEDSQRAPPRPGRDSRRSWPTRAGESDAITMKEYGALEEAFAHLNRVLFDGKLPDAMFNHARKPHMFGHFVPDRYSGRVVEFRKPEIALNPDSFIDRTDEQIVSTLAHEMVHLCDRRFRQTGLARLSQQGMGRDDEGNRPDAVEYRRGRRQGDRPANDPLHHSRWSVCASLRRSRRHRMEVKSAKHDLRGRREEAEEGQDEIHLSVVRPEPVGQHSRRGHQLQCVPVRHAA